MVIDPASTSAARFISFYATLVPVIRIHQAKNGEKK